MVLAPGRRKLSTAWFAILRPCSIPSSTALRKWNPTRMRESPFSSAASEKPVYLRRTGDSSSQVLPVGSVRLQVSKAMLSVPKTRFNTVAATAPSTACAES